MDPWTACHDPAYNKVYGAQYCDGAVGDEDPSNDEFTVRDALKTIQCPHYQACIGSERSETILGRRGGDKIGARGWNDQVYAGQGYKDWVRGGDGNDTLYGEGGNDLLLGQAGNDRLIGGLRSDDIVGEAGQDFVKAGEGNDDIRMRDGQKDRIDCGTGDDEVAVDRFGVVSTSCETVRD
jgi:Ca2+-binding RTX toxin-like protein